MSVSLRPYLMAGAAAATATALALTPIQVVPADVAVPAHPTTAQPHLTEAMVKLLAAAGNMASPKPPAAGVIPNVGQKVGPNPLAAVPLAAAPVVGPQNAASDWLTGAYQGIQAWVDWGVNYATDLLYWAGWFVPFSGTIAAQTDIFYWTLIRPVSDNIFYQAVVPIVNDPLNLGVWVNGIGNAIRYSVNDVINFGIAEFNYFLGWLIPPIPPLPPIGSLAATTPTLDSIAKSVQTALTSLAAAINPAKTSTKADPAAKLAPTAAQTQAPAEKPANIDTTTEKGTQTEATGTGQPQVGEPKTELKTDPKTDPKADPKTDPKAELKTEPKTDPKADTKPDPKAGAPAAGDTDGSVAQQQDDAKATKPVKKPGKKDGDKTGTTNPADNQAAGGAGTTDTKPGNVRSGKVTGEKTAGQSSNAGSSTGSQNSGSDNHGKAGTQG